MRKARTRRAKGSQMKRLKKWAIWTAKAIVTLIAFRIYPAFGGFVGIALFFGMDSFIDGRR